MDVKDLWDSKKGRGPFWCPERKFGFFFIQDNTTTTMSDNFIEVTSFATKRGDPPSQQTKILQDYVKSRLALLTD